MEKQLGQPSRLRALHKAQESNHRQIALLKAQMAGAQVLNAPAPQPLSALKAPEITPGVSNRVLQICNEIPGGVVHGLARVLGMGTITPSSCTTERTLHFDEDKNETISPIRETIFPIREDMPNVLVSLGRPMGKPRRRSSPAAQHHPGDHDFGAPEITGTTLSGKAEENDRLGRERIRVAQDNMTIRRSEKQWEQATDRLFIEGQQLFDANALHGQYDFKADNAVRLYRAPAGVMMSSLNCKQAHKLACYMLKRAEYGTLVHLYCFTFGLQCLTDALTGAAVRGVRVDILADRRATFAGTTRGQLAHLKQCQSCGCQVSLLSGVPIQDEYKKIGRAVYPGTGILHAKTLMVGRYLLLGSANWTTSSACNIEDSVLLYLSESGLEERVSRFEAAMASSVELTRTLENQIEHDRALQSEP